MDLFDLGKTAYVFRNIADYSTVLVNEDGTVDEADEYLPEYHDDTLTEGWITVSDGYTGQYGYNGPVMHDSEFFGGYLAEDVLSTPGVYALVTAEWFTCDGNLTETFSEGWVVARRVGKEDS